MIDSDKHWIRLGQMDPYLKTVKTLDPYKLDRALLASNVVEPYFESGERYLSDLFDAIERHVMSGFQPTIGVDFGCSVGRIAIPLARRCQAVLGVDISADALAEAGRNAARLGVTNARWLSSDDDLTQVPAPIDLFHSYNVLQHMPVRRGLQIIRVALSRLGPGGVFAVHVPYADRASVLRRAINWTQAYVPGVHGLANIARGRPRDYPHMLMNAYDLAEIFSLLEGHGCVAAHCKLIDQGRYPGAIVIARKSGQKASSATGTE
jgi:SAM-dependent methyltransferase